MTGLHKFSLKKFCFTFVTTAFCIVITWECEARDTFDAEIYTTLTTDTIPVPKIDSVSGPSMLQDTTPVNENLITTSVTDTFSFRFSKDTLDAPVTYNALDSGVLLVKEKKFILYGNTKTVYKDVTLTAPKMELDQQTNILTAVYSRDSLGNVIARAHFTQGSEGFQSDTIRFNFETQKGLTKNTFTKQQDLFMNAELFKKINASTTFAQRVTMTTCEFDEPHFGFVANKGKFVSEKIAVTGPIHPEFEEVPIPIYLPFGIFPLNKGRHSGLLPPQFTVNQDYGLGLEGLGYYHVLNDYIDVTLRTNIYSYGGWSMNIVPNYRKRYRYNGGLSINIQRTKSNFKGDPDYSVFKTFNITWNHSVDPRARPGTNFSASVNAGSTRYNELLPNNPNRNFQNQLGSSINYSKRWEGKPYNLTLAANHNQNSVSRLVNVSLPDAGFSVSTIYPFQRKEPIGAPKWYEKIGVGYSGVFRNQFSFYDTAVTSFTKILDTMLWGAQHRFPINFTLPPAGPVLIAPFISYEETWLTRRMGFEWNPTLKKVDTAFDREGLFIDRQMSFGIGMNTALYGLFPFNNDKIKLRHVMRPNINFNYRPNMSRKYYDVIQVDTTGRIEARAQVPSGRNLFSGYGYGEFGGITFGIDNNLEMKHRPKGDSVDKKVRLIDGWGFTSGYNFLQDSLKLSPFNLYFRTTLFEKVSITAQGLYDPYQKDSLGRPFNKFVWQGDKFRLGRINSGSISMSTTFQSKPRDPDKQPANQQSSGISDPNLLAERERLQEYMRRNPAEFVDFNIPWSLNLSFSLTFNEYRRPDRSIGTRFTSHVSFTNSFSLTPKWNITTNGYYDIVAKKMNMFTMSVSRDMHCWQMSVSVTPIGPSRYFNITISPKSSLLQDLRVNRTRYFTDF